MITLTATTGQNDYRVSSKTLRGALIKLKKEQYGGWYKINIRRLTDGQPIEATWYGDMTVTDIAQQLRN